MLLRNLLLFCIMQSDSCDSAKADIPTIFWNSEGHVGNNTVLAMGGQLAEATVQLSSSGGGAIREAQVLQSSDASIAFVLPPDGSATQIWGFRACVKNTSKARAGGANSCSEWRTINRPDVWWASGDNSNSSVAVASSKNGRLYVFGRGIGFSSTGCPAASVGTNYPATRIPSVSLVSQKDGTVTTVKAIGASCYDAVFHLPGGCYI